MRRPLVLAAVVALTTAAAPAGDDAARADQWHLDVVGAPVEGAHGDGVVVAVVDSGVDLDHPDMADRLLPGVDLVDGDDEPDDPYGHGTHVAGIVAARLGGGEAVGVAPGARILPVRVLDGEGDGLVEDVVEGVRWAIDHGADVVNLSLGEDAVALLGPSFGDVLREAWAAGAVPVVAAGARFDDEPALVVTATNRADEAAAYATGVGGAAWGLAAPGGDPPEGGERAAILSTYRDGDYAWVAGTSQAAPVVSGAVAALLGLGLTPREAVDRLLATAVDLGPPGRDPTFGAGRLDLARAVEGLVAPATTTTTATTAPAADDDAGTDTGTEDAGTPRRPLVLAVLVVLGGMAYARLRRRREG